MKNKILIPLIIVGALAAFFSFKYSSGSQSTEERRALIVETVMKTIQAGHYSPRDIDDTLSDRVFHKMLNEVDPLKQIFTKQDIAHLSKYQFQIDDEIKAGSIEFYDTLDALFNRRVDDAQKYYDEILKTPFTFDGNEQIQMSPDKKDYAANDAALKVMWHDYLKYSVLSKYVDLKNDQDKNKDSLKTPLKADSTLEREARNSVRKSEGTIFKRFYKRKDDDRFTAYVNAITLSEDPHTEYFPPKDKKKFDEMMSGSFYGIGAQLKEEDDGKIKVASIVTGSPCWKEGELKAGDEIAKVAQGTHEPVDIQGYEIDDVVKLIRGDKGSEVRLTVKRKDGSTKIIPIIRGEVQTEETFAKSAIIKSDAGPIGYISLPEFYSDFNGISGRRCSTDVEIEVKKLKAAGVKGIILDLRGNGGGSLSDVVDMAGIFVGGGPVVQVKNNHAAPSTLRAQAGDSITYTGPLAVMVNEGSASASEILAAALQDYGRAVIVGSNTYGKGTVQKMVPLDQMIDPMTRMHMQADTAGLAMNADGSYESSIGSLKITMEKFYRVNGGSTQMKGVKPDIVIPDPYEYKDMGEREDKAALKWDEIPKATYKPTNSVGNLAQLNAMSQSRIANNQTFKLIDEGATKLKKREEDNMVSLNEKEYRKELEDVNATSKQIDSLQKKSTKLEFSNLGADLTRINADSASITKNKDWLRNLGKDIYISETVNIVDDMTKSGMKITRKSEGITY